MCQLRRPMDRALIGAHVGRSRSAPAPRGPGKQASAFAVIGLAMAARTFARPFMLATTLATTLAATLATTLAVYAGPSLAQSTQPQPAAVAQPTAAAVALQGTVQKSVPAVLQSLKELVEIESGSRDLEGLRRLSGVIAARLKAADFEVQTIAARAPEFHPMLKGAELGTMVYARKTGRGTHKVLLIAHMDTVYPKGTLDKQPFRIEGSRAYGLGIADDKAGVALILHTVELLRSLGEDGYAELAVLINGDEELGSPGSAAMLTDLGSRYDAVLSFEGGGGMYRPSTFCSAQAAKANASAGVRMFSA